MIDPLYFLQKPKQFKNICKIYPPSINDVLCTDNFFKYVKALTTTKDEIEDQMEQLESNNHQIPTPLEYILINSYYNEQFKQILEEAFQFFTHEHIILLYDVKSIVLSSIEQLQDEIDINQLHIIDETNFFDFQNAIRESIGYKLEDAPDPDESPVVANIKKKARRRERLKLKQQQNSTSFTVYLSAICCMGIGLNPLNIGEISYASVSTLIDMYQAKEKYETDLQSIIAGADPKKVKPQYWIREKSDLVEVKI